MNPELDEDDKKRLLKLKAHALANERMKKALSDAQEKLGLSLEEIESLINDPTLFTEEEWVELQNHRKSIDESVALKLKSLRDPVKTKKTFSERGEVRPHWLFVR